MAATSPTHRLSAGSVPRFGLRAKGGRDEPSAAPPPRPGPLAAARRLLAPRDRTPHRRPQDHHHEPAGRCGPAQLPLLERELRDLRCPIVEADELWTFCRKKEFRLTPSEQLNPELGDQYAYVALDPRSKLVLAHVVGRREPRTTCELIRQVRTRVRGRIELFTDGFKEYVTAVERYYGADVDYAQVIKPRKLPDGTWELEIVRRMGDPNPLHIGTAYVERNNATIRQQIRRFTRMTFAFSKKLRNLQAAFALYVAWYDFCRIHSSLRVTPAMAAGVTQTVWEIERLLP